MQNAEGIMATQKNRNVFRDARLQDAFEKNAFVIVPLLDPDEVSTLRASTMEVYPDELSFLDPAFASYMHADKPRALHVQDIVRSIIGPKLATYLEDFRPQQAGVINKPPRGDRLVPHLHSPVTENLLDQVVVCWCPLVDTSLSNGGFQLVPRSHRLLWHVKTNLGPHFWPEDNPSIIDKRLITLEVKAGEAVIFDTTLVHGSAANPTDLIRPAVVCQNVPLDSTQVFYVEPEQANGELGIYRAFDELSYPDLAYGRLPPQESWERLGSMPDRRVFLNDAQFEALLSRGVRIAPGVDPYQFVAHLADPAPVVRPANPETSRPLLRRAAGKIRRLAGRIKRSAFG